MRACVRACVSECVRACVSVSPGAHCAKLKLPPDGAEEDDGGGAGRASMLGRTRIHLLRDERRSMRGPACLRARACESERVRARAPPAAQPLAKLTSCRRQGDQGDADMFPRAVPLIP